MTERKRSFLVFLKIPNFISLRTPLCSFSPPSPSAVCALVLHAELQELGICRGEVLEEALLVPRVQLHVLLELCVLQQPQVAGQHHQLPSLCLVLQRPLPRLSLVRLLLGPLLLQQQPEIVVGEGVNGIDPSGTELWSFFCGSASHKIFTINTRKKSCGHSDSEARREIITSPF